MIITINQLLNSGLDISEELSDYKLTMAIQTAEQYIVKNRLGELYSEIEANPTEYYTTINGGTVTIDDKEYNVTGLKYAIYHLAYSYLIRQNITSTIFGSVQKKDDYSSNVNGTEIKDFAIYHNEIAMAYLNEIATAYGCEKPKYNNNYFEQL